MHALVARLVKSGDLRKQTLPTGRTGYELAHAQPEASAGSAPDAADAAYVAHDGVELAPPVGLPPPAGGST